MNSVNTNLNHNTTASQPSFTIERVNKSLDHLESLVEELQDTYPKADTSHKRNPPEQSDAEFLEILHSTLENPNGEDKVDRALEQIAFRHGIGKQPEPSIFKAQEPYRSVLEDLHL